MIFENRRLYSDITIRICGMAVVCRQAEPAVTGQKKMT
jgi:hypothetical protein